MAQDRPTIGELLEAVREFLSQRVAPELEGHTAFHTRVSINVLAMLERELALGPALDAAERERLETLLGRRGSLDELNAELAQCLRQGGLDERRDEVVAHLRETVRGKLSIANPRYIDDSR
jgi:hypothetical protein